MNTLKHWIFTYIPRWVLIMVAGLAMFILAVAVIVGIGLTFIAIAQWLIGTFSQEAAGAIIAGVIGFFLCLLIWWDDIDKMLPARKRKDSDA